MIINITREEEGERQPISRHQQLSQSLYKTTGLVVQLYNYQMKIVILILLGLLVMSTSVTIDSSHNMMAGGFTQGTPVPNQNSLDNEFSKINTFIRANAPEVNGLELISYRTQVVAGVNYCYTYGKREGETVTNTIQLCVWSQPWEHDFLQLTLSNGKVVTSGGKP